MLGGFIDLFRCSCTAQWWAGYFPGQKEPSPVLSPCNNEDLVEVLGAMEMDQKMRERTLHGLTSAATDIRDTHGRKFLFGHLNGVRTAWLEMLN